MAAGQRRLPELLPKWVGAESVGGWLICQLPMGGSNLSLRVFSLCLHIGFAY